MEVSKMISDGYSVLNLGIGNPDQMPAPAVIEALKVAVDRKEVHGYQPYKGLPELREAIAHWNHRTYGISLDPGTEVLPLIGSKEGITHISLAFLDEGDQVLIPELAYPAYASVANLAKAEAISFPLIEEDNWEPDWAFLEKLDCSNVKILWVNYPNMPTGRPASRALFQKYIDFAKRKKILVCHDNPYSLILNQHEPISILSIEGAREVAVELNSMSKSHNMAGWRLGWVSGEKDYIETILRVKSNVDSGTFKPMQLAAVEGLKSGPEWSISLNKLYQQRKTLVCAFFDLLGCTYRNDQEGMFVWAKVGDRFDGSGEALADYLLYEHHIFITPGFIFGSKGSGYVRMSLCSDQSLYQEAIERISEK